MKYKTVNLLYSIFLVFFIVHSTNSYMKCGNAECQAIISKGVTIQRYPSITKNVLSCNIDEVVQVYGKAFGNDNDLWDVEINTKRGLFPSRFIKENTIFISLDKLVTVQSQNLTDNTTSGEPIGSEDVVLIGNDVDYKNLVKNSHTADSSKTPIVSDDSSKISNGSTNSSEILNVPTDPSKIPIAAPHPSEIPIASVDSSEIPKVSADSSELSIASADSSENHNVSAGSSESPMVLVDSSEIPNVLVEGSEIPMSGKQPNLDAGKSNVEALSSELPPQSENVDIKTGDTSNADNSEKGHIDNDFKTDGNGDESVEKAGILENESQSKLNSQFSNSSGSNVTENVNDPSSTIKIASHHQPGLKHQQTDDSKIINKDSSNPGTNEDHIVRPYQHADNVQHQHPQQPKFANYNLWQKQPYAAHHHQQKAANNPKEQPNYNLGKYPEKQNTGFIPQQLQNHNYNSQQPSEADNTREQQQNANQDTEQQQILSDHHEQPPEINNNIANSSLDKSILKSVTKKQSTHEGLNAGEGIISEESIGFSAPKPNTLLKSLEGKDELLPAAEEERHNILKQELESAAKMVEAKDADEELTRIKFIGQEVSDDILPRSVVHPTEEIPANHDGYTTQEKLEDSNKATVVTCHNENSDIEGCLQSANGNSVPQDTCHYLGGLGTDNAEQCLNDATNKVISKNSHITDETNEDDELSNEDNMKVDDIKDAFTARSPLESHETKRDPADIEGDLNQQSLYLLVSEYVLNTLKPMLGQDLSFILETEIFYSSISMGSVALLVIISVTIIMLYLIHHCVVKMSKEAPMLKEMNDIKRNMRFAIDENMNLKTKLDHTTEQIQSAAMNSVDVIAKVELQSELMQTKENYSKLVQSYEEKIQQIEQELDESTSNGLEMHKMLDELLQSQNDSSNFQASVESLQNKLDTQKEKIESLTTDLAMKIHFNDELHIELKSSMDKISKLDSQVDELNSALREVNSSMSNASKELKTKQLQISKLEEVKSSFMKEVESSKSKVNHLTERGELLQLSLRDAKAQLNLKDAEILVSKECCKKLQRAGNKNISLTELFGVIEVKKNLKVVENEKTKLKKELEMNMVEKQKVCANLKEVEETIEQFKSDCDKACLERDESVSKLTILTDYFKEKESELTKELESQEHLRVNAEGSFAGIENRIHNYETEVATYRSTVDTLKVELEDQQQSYKMQLNTEGKKSHDNWIAARTAERHLEELRKENSQLRQRLTTLARNDSQNVPLLKPLPSRMEANGNASSPASTDGDMDRSLNSPLDMNHMPHLPHPMLPPMYHGGPPMPPPPFMGHLPPPPPPLPGRLPPAGRIASPSFRRRSSPQRYTRSSYSPGSDYSNYSDRCYSPPQGRYSPGPRSSPERSRQRREHIQNNIASPPSRMPHSPWYPPSDNMFYDKKYPQNLPSDKHRSQKGDKSSPAAQNER